MYKKNIILYIFFLLFVPTALSQHNYVQTQGTHFILNGNPYYFVGTNFWYGCYISSTGQTGNRERLLRELDRLKANGIDNLRILGASEASTNQDVVKPAIQTSPGVYDDSLLIGLDFLLSEMDKRDMKAIVFLNNYWNWSGGMAQYLTWFGGGGGFDASRFYRNASAKAAFKQYITNLITRQNTVTGLYYYEDPAIMAWELANEPRPGSNSAYYNSFYYWIDSTAEYIHSLDTNHLVTTGNEGTKGCNENADIFLNAHQSSFIDYATIHVWALNWGWIDPNDMSGTYSDAVSQASDYIRNHIGYARQLNKPLTMEEFGFPRDNEEYSPDSTTTYRDNYYTALLQLVYDSAATGAPIAGSNFWGWGGEGRSPNADFTWLTGDPFVCDPPMEAQGLNSVFDTDSSTNNIIKEYSFLMASLRVSTGVVEENSIRTFKLDQNYPNPFNPSTIIGYQIPNTGHVTLKVYDILGREIVNLIHGMKEAGYYSVIFDGSRLSSGVYFYRLEAGKNIQVKKLILLK
jgi:mannan endo-1,4-beta-mannosidase